MKINIKIGNQNKRQSIKQETKFKKLLDKFKKLLDIVLAAKGKSFRIIFNCMKQYVISFKQCLACLKMRWIYVSVKKSRQ